MAMGSTPPGFVLWNGTTVMWMPGLAIGRLVVGLATRGRDGRHVDHVVAVEDGLDRPVPARALSPGSRVPTSCVRSGDQSSGSTGSPCPMLMMFMATITSGEVASPVFVTVVTKSISSPVLTSAVSMSMSIVSDAGSTADCRMLVALRTGAGRCQHAESGHEHRGDHEQRPRRPEARRARRGASAGSAVATRPRARGAVQRRAGARPSDDRREDVGDQVVRRTRSRVRLLTMIFSRKELVACIGLSCWMA